MPWPASLPPGADAAACRATLVANLKYAAEKLAARNIVLLLEAINTRDMPGFIVSTQKDSHAICEAVGAPNLKMQMDIYHMQVMEGDLDTTLKQYASQCGSHQIAGCPERHEPDTGEIRYEYLFSLLDEIGYRGMAGLRVSPGRQNHRRPEMVQRRHALKKRMKKEKQMSKIGFIGLGIMGKPMLRNLRKAGHELVAYDVVAASVDAVVGEGIERGFSCKDVAARTDVVITMLPTGLK